MKQYYAMIAAAGALWGLLSLFFEVLSAAGLTSPQAVGVRTACAAVVMWLWLFVRDRRALKLKTWKHLWYFGGTGMISLAFFNSCYFACIERSTIGLAALLLYTAPVFVMLFSAVLFGEKLTGRKIGASWAVDWRPVHSQVVCRCIRRRWLSVWPRASAMPSILSLANLPCVIMIPAPSQHILCCLQPSVFCPSRSRYRLHALCFPRRKRSSWHYAAVCCALSCPICCTPRD